jgi:hypothetical protein
MERLNENRISPLVNRGDFTRGIPFYGPNGDFNFTMGRSQFTPGVSIKQTPLTDMSVKGDPGFTEFDLSIAKLRNFFKPGDRIRGIIVNSQLDSENGRMAVGKLHKIQPDYSNNTIRAWIKNPKTLELQEVYIESIERIYESAHRALTFSQFINS